MILKYNLLDFEIQLGITLASYYSCTLIEQEGFNLYLPFCETASADVIETFN